MTQAPPGDAPPRALGAVRTYALEVVLGTIFGAIGIRVATVFLGELEPRDARLLVTVLAVWVGLLAGAIRVARAGRGRAPPAVTLCVIAAPALGVVAPVALQLAFTRAVGADPFSGWDSALDKVLEVIDPTSLESADPAVRGLAAQRLSEDPFVVRLTDEERRRLEVVLAQ